MAWVRQALSSAVAIVGGALAGIVTAALFLLVWVLLGVLLAPIAAVSVRQARTTFTRVVRTWHVSDRLEALGRGDE